MGGGGHSSSIGLSTPPASGLRLTRLPLHPATPHTPTTTSDDDSHGGPSSGAASSLDTGPPDTPASSYSEGSPTLPFHPTTIKAADVKFPLSDIRSHQAIGTVRIPLSSDRLSNHPANYRDMWTEFYRVQDAFPSDYPGFRDISRLLKARWLRIEGRRNSLHPDWASVRLLVLPDDVGRASVDRSRPADRACLKRLLAKVDISSAAWNAVFDPHSEIETMRLEAGEDQSLSYLFNSLPSPIPHSEGVKDPYTRSAMESLLENDVEGLKTRLYPYQQRSAALMLQKEASPGLVPDPRLQQVKGPDDSIYYIDVEAGSLARERQRYDGPRGGILAETMGLGKTLICLAVVLATRDHWPRRPAELPGAEAPVRKTVGSLFDMSASAIGRHHVPWKDHFGRLQRSQDQDHERCVNALKHYRECYMMPNFVSQRSRHEAPERRIYYSTGTVIVCPANLLQQWKYEIQKHCNDGHLHMLVVDQARKELPPTKQLVEYDIVLFSRQRFDSEEQDGAKGNLRKTNSRRHYSAYARPASNISLDDSSPSSSDGYYRSPLMEIHWKRLIVDEGHNHGNSDISRAAVVADQMLVERRWIVSGTPANSLIGVEVGVAPCQEEEHSVAQSRMEQASKRSKKAPSAQEEKDVDKIGNIVTSFLKVRPWAKSRFETAASWRRYVGPKSVLDGPSKAHCVRSTLESIVVKHQQADVDVKLPPLHNNVVHLEPCFYDKVGINVFLLTLAANAVTSEREDSDFLFHPSNRKALNELISNLRRAGFFWSGFSPHDVESTVKVSREYLNKERTKCTIEDRHLLLKAIKAGEVALSDSGWKSFGRFHELGFFVADFPDQARQEWALDGLDANTILMGPTQLLLAQKHIDSQLNWTDPDEGLVGAGIKAMSAAKRTDSSSLEKSSLASKGATLASLVGKPELAVKQHARQDPTAAAVPKDTIMTSISSEVVQAPSEIIQRDATTADPPSLSADSPLARSRVVGVASAKLAYLIDSVVKLSPNEKILIAYEGDDIAWYIAQAFEILNIPHLIYAKSITNARRAQYLVTFNTTEKFRVLLMDVRQASHGLNLSSASRVYFVNPIWQPNVEAQAIKRAHRLGQTRPVYVETLVLKGTIEEKMLERRKAMTHDEHEKTQKTLLDDVVMKGMIQTARFLDISEGEKSGEGRMARLQLPQPVFGRRSRQLGEILDPDADLVILPESPVTTSKPSLKKATNESDEELMEISQDVFMQSGSKKAQIEPQIPFCAVQNPFPVDRGCVLGSPTPPPARSRLPSRKRLRIAEDDDEDDDEDGESICRFSRLRSHRGSPPPKMARFLSPETEADDMDVENTAPVKSGPISDGLSTSFFAEVPVSVLPHGRSALEEFVSGQKSGSTKPKKMTRFAIDEEVIAKPDGRCGGGTILPAQHGHEDTITVRCPTSTPAVLESQTGGSAGSSPKNPWVL
ncbi:MAG: hypothetical protein M1817_002621 [Caeruleum heppii]|nr:MAG: hypothetical protein M1817_002621 [Caeruleum heppii]